MRTRFTKFWSLALAAALATGCTAEKEPEAVPLPESYNVPVETALSHLRGMIDGFSKTRSSAHSFDATDVQTLRTGTVQQTRSGAANSDEALAYVVNFDEGGYAILGADSRLFPVIAVVEQGTMSPETLAAAKQKMDAGEELDLATYIDATVVSNMLRTLNDPAAQPLAGVEIELVESAGPLMVTQWGPQDINATPTAIAFAQMLLYNAKYMDHRPYMIYNYAIKWNAIEEAATTPHLIDGPGSEYIVAKDLTNAITSGMNFKYNQGKHTIEQIIWLMRDTGGAYGGLYSTNDYIYFYNKVGFELVRNMVFIENLPVFMSIGLRSWVVDGWVRYKFTGVAPSEEPATADFVNVNYGMGGSHNGFYQLPNITPSSPEAGAPACFDYFLNERW